MKVYLSDDEFRTLQIATTLSAFETQSDFIAHTMLATAEEVCAHVSQLFCGVAPLWRPTNPSHPLVNERGDLLCSKIL